MKKLLTLLLALLLIFSFVACDSGSIEKDDEDDKKTNQSNKGDKNDIFNPIFPDTDSGFQEVTVEETVLVDEAGVKITVTGMEMDGFFGPELKVLIENNSGKDLDISTGNVVVNGWMSDGSLYETIKNGKKTNTAVAFFDSSLEECEIDSIAVIELDFIIRESGNYMENYLETEMFTIETSAADAYDGSYDNSGEVVYDDNDIRVIYREYYVDEIFGPYVILLIENNSNESVTVSSSDLCVNGYMVDGSFYASLLPGRHAISSITFLEDSLEDNGITDFEILEFGMQIFNNETYDEIDTVDSLTIEF